MQLICSFVSHMQKAGFHKLGLKISAVLYKTTLFEGLQRAAIKNHTVSNDNSRTLKKIKDMTFTHPLFG